MTNVYTRLHQSLQQKIHNRKRQVDAVRRWSKNIGGFTSPDFMALCRQRNRARLRVRRSGPCDSDFLLCSLSRYTLWERIVEILSGTRTAILSEKFCFLNAQNRRPSPPAPFPTVKGKRSPWPLGAAPWKISIICPLLGTNLSYVDCCGGRKLWRLQGYLEWQMDCKEICHGKLLKSKFVYESVIVVQCAIISLLLAKCSVCPHQLERKKQTNEFTCQYFSLSVADTYFIIIIITIKIMHADRTSRSSLQSWQRIVILDRN